MRAVVVMVTVCIRDWELSEGCSCHDYCLYQGLETE